MGTITDTRAQRSTKSILSFTINVIIPTPKKNNILNVVETYAPNNGLRARTTIVLLYGFAISGTWSIKSITDSFTKTEVMNVKAKHAVMATQIVLYRFFQNNGQKKSKPT